MSLKIYFYFYCFYFGRFISVGREITRLNLGAEGKRFWGFAGLSRAGVEIQGNSGGRILYSLTTFRRTSPQKLFLFSLSKTTNM